MYKLFLSRSHTNGNQYKTQIDAFFFFLPVNLMSHTKSFKSINNYNTNDWLQIQKLIFIITIIILMRRSQSL